MTTEQAKDSAPDVALVRYGQVLDYLQHENSSYWQRFSFILAAQAILITGAAQQCVEALKSGAHFSVMIAFGAGILGLALCVLGQRMNEGALRWIDHWLKILRDLEPLAHQGTRLFDITGDEVRGSQNPSIREAAKHVMSLLSIAWIALLSSFAGSLISRC